ncbi:MAG TPA: MBOAT family O-acyltransferase [Leptospiraceae bacterium]|nr:MBOAT family O-acyltransferase [Leptospiraceae bacterium]HNN73374.1 MBOAT family O-acyltransferase [Leptospiraceae bacterium]
MLFNSLAFLIFFPAVTISYFLLPHRFRWLLLLLASCYFYMAFVPEYILILAATIAVDFYAGIMIGRAEGKKKANYLMLSVLVNIAFLFVFKYYGFFRENVNSAVGSDLIPLYKIVLPIGLSFHTFQSLSYIFEVYYGRQVPVTHFGRYALFVMYYPQLVCGPIERPFNLLKQFLVERRFLFSRFQSGMTLMLWGFFKKLVVADRLGMFVDRVWKEPGSFGGIYLFLAACFFSIQIYCDFSGYTDIARGASRVMGIRLMLNFDLPFFSKSIPELWRRWHISLSSWFRDYVYIPMGGGKVSTVRKHFNVMVLFLLSGFWHGANWTFIIWGGFHGVLTVLSQVTAGFRQWFLRATMLDRIPRVMDIWRIVLTFLLFSLGAIFFRAKTLSDSLTFIAGIPSLSLKLPADIRIPYDIKSGLLVLGILVFIETLLVAGSLNRYFRKYRLIPLQGLLLAAILVAGVFEKQSFIYFQF